MRILKPGTKTPPMFRGACQKCGCEFEEERDRLKVEGWRNEELARVFCPQCQAQAFMYPVRT